MPLLPDPWPPSEFRVLLVEDDGITARYIEHCLRGAGYPSLLVSTTAEGALRLAEADRPSLLLVDIVLRGEMDGIEAAARIHERTGAPVLFVTALGDQATRERAMATGASGFLVKPFLGRELDAAIRGALQHPDPGLRRRQPSASPPSTPSVVPRSHEALRVLAEELRRHNDELTRDRRRAEERSEHYRSLYELAPDAYLVTDAMTVIQEANQAAGLLLGVEPERLSGKPLSLFIAHDEHHTYDQQLDHLRRDPRRRQWQTVLCPRGRHPFHGSLAILPVCDPAGHPVALRWTIRDASACVAGEHALREARDHLETLLRERTSELAGLNAALESERAERRCVEKSLREGRQLLQAVEDAALGMVYARDLRQQGPIHANTRVLERLGYPSDAARLPAPDQATDLVHPEDGAAAKDHRERLCHAADGEVVETTVRLRHSDGSWRWVRFREVVSGRDAAGEPLRGTGTAEDVTEQRAAQTALADAQRLIDAGRLAASFAHEINNPLQGALGCLSLLEEALSEGGEPGRYLEMAQDQTRRAVRVVGQLRDLSRLVPAHAERVATDLRTSLSRVAVVVEKRCSDQRVELIWDPPDAVPDVLADPDAIEEVFLNLTLNALDAMPDGGTLRLAIESTAAPPGVRVTCADSGPGIDTELLPRLFDSFVTNKTEGMGLGLYVSRDIVEQHGGRIEVETQAGRGTTFFVWLALHATPSASPLDRPSPPL